MGSRSKGGPVPASKHAWWKEATVYQIYPASFLDTNEDGWGNINGITAKLDYLKDLGVDIIWSCPIFKSPKVDMGYDISDYKEIDPDYGSLEDVDRLIFELKKRNMMLMMDLVVNHTSDQHEWFKESRSSVDSPKRDWYIWHKPKYDADGNRRPPNNWAQILGEGNSAWTWDEATGEYYLSLFSPEQPDLNWENADVREAIYDILRFWLDRGCSGFRLDVINHISKWPGFPDAPIHAPDHEFQPGYSGYTSGPRLHEYLKEMNRKVLSKYDTITVGEMPFVTDTKEIMRAVGAQEEELNMIFIFDLCDIDNTPGGFRLTLHPFDVRDVKSCISKWQRIMLEQDGWNSVFLENHDNCRSVSRYTDDSDEWRELGAKLLCLMQTTLGGTQYVYQGQELGMRNIPPSWPVEEYKDIETINYWKKMNKMYPNDPEKLKYAKHVIQRKARDHARTPMQWSSAPNAGFCKPHVKPWMRVHDDYVTVNAEIQQQNDNPNKTSVWHFWQHALKARKDHKDIFVYGDFYLVDPDNPKIFAYLRTGSVEGGALVVLNFSEDEVDWEIPADVKLAGWMVGNYSAARPEKNTSGKIKLRAWEGLLGKFIS